MRRGYVSLEPVHGFLVRFHPQGKGAGSPHSFAVVVDRVADGWEFKGAAGRYTRLAAKAIRLALSRAGFARIKRLSGYGAQERIITMEAIKMKDLLWRGEVSYAGKYVGHQENGWGALPEDDYNKLTKEGTDCVMVAKSLEEKNNGQGYAITFTGSTTETETGVVKKDPVVVIELSEKGLDKYLQRVGKFGQFLIDWAHDDVEHGKKTGWDHSKSKPVKPQPKDE